MLLFPFLLVACIRYESDPFDRYRPGASGLAGSGVLPGVLCRYSAFARVSLVLCQMGDPRTLRWLRTKEISQNGISC